MIQAILLGIDLFFIYKEILKNPRPIQKVLYTYR